MSDAAERMPERLPIRPQRGPNDPLALLDDRQVLGAVLLLSAAPLPAPAPAVAKLMLDAARLWPGIDVRTAMFGDRRGALARVRELVDQMLGEIDG